MIIKVLKDWLASRPRSKPVTTIVLHATDGASAASSIAWLRHLQLNRNKKDDASYHYIIERDGVATKCVPLSRDSFPAGVSVGPQGKDCNRYSIGISFANFESKKESITEAQVAACCELVKELTESDPKLEWLTTHYWVAPKRKTDPARLRLQDLSKFVAAGNLTIWRPK